MTWEPFETLVDRYEAWFEQEPGRSLFPSELEAVRRVARGAPGPWVEIGVGTGAFAAPLCMDLGIDPSRPMLERAGARGVPVVEGVAEALPLRDGSVGTAFLIVTICFLRDPRAALRQIRYALKPGGSLIIGEIPRDSPWGQRYLALKEEGNPFYRVATLYTVRETVAMLRGARFRVEAFASTLLRPPTERPEPEPAHDGVVTGASFVALRAVKL
ncbi:MAG TPA: class I SAM-dependent methyltransferase [Dehalococcoidia bacterium]|nr:class I SAM-dependent methyltransferase [Dehalococcoidia bacterium]